MSRHHVFNVLSRTNCHIPVVRGAPSPCRTNILERYNNEEVRLKLPDGKRVSRVTWLAVYDLASQNAFGDVYIPEDFEAPAPRSLTPLVAAPGHQLSSQPVKFLDASTFM